MTKKTRRGFMKEVVVPVVIDVGITAIEMFGCTALMGLVSPSAMENLKALGNEHKITSTLVKGCTITTLAAANLKICDSLSEPINDSLDSLWEIADMKKVMTLYDKNYTDEQISVLAELPLEHVVYLVKSIERDRVKRKGENAKLRKVKVKKEDEEPEE